MRFAPLLLTAALAATATLAGAEQGQGPVEGDNVHIDGLNLGEYWYGKSVTKQDLVGKVVLFEMWGS